MHARIGAAGARCLDFLSQHGLQRLLQFLLHRDSILLDLPSMIGGAFVCDFQKVALSVCLHGAKLRNFTLSECKDRRYKVGSV